MTISFADHDEAARGWALGAAHPSSTPLGVSVVICTVQNSGREQRLKLVLDELSKQVNVIVEVIIVWQGWDLASAPTYSGARVIALDVWSSSVARNRGGEQASHPFICFLDDDTYPVGERALSDLVTLLNRESLDFVTCNIRSDGDIQAGSHVKNDIDLTRRSIIGNMWEPGLTLRAEAFLSTRFDPTVGIGCIHGSSEGLDFGLRLIAGGYRGRRLAGQLIDHPPLSPDQSLKLDRSFLYALGNGSVLIQHKMYGAYVAQVFKSVVRLGISTLRRDGVRIRAAAIRTLCLLLGPMIPRGTPVIVPRRSV
jgi:hypothetical protein